MHAGVPAVINVFDEFAAGLTGLESDTHINVIGWFDKADRAPLMVRPRKINLSSKSAAFFSALACTAKSTVAQCHTSSKVDGPLLYSNRLILSTDHRSWT